MGVAQKGIMYQVTFLPDAEKSFQKLDKPVQVRIAEKIDWLAENADKVIHHQLVSLPDDLKGLCRMRAGDYRILYWVYDESKHIKIYEVEHRGKEYRSVHRKR